MDEGQQSSWRRPPEFQSSGYSLSGGNVMPSLLRNGVPVKYFVIPIPESSYRALDQIELKFHEHEGMVDVILGYLKKSLILTLVLTLVTMLLVFAVNGIIDHYGGEDIGNFTFPTIPFNVTIGISTEESTTMQTDKVSTSHPAMISTDRAVALSSTSVPTDL